MFKQATLLAISSMFTTAIVGLGACGNRAKLETCKFVEIEEGEFEVEFGDIDAERGEVEMVCGDEILDVTWEQFRRRLGIDPETYISDLEGFKSLVTCARDERSRREELFCQGPDSGGEFVALRFSYDD
ncbi:MAG: hypothetical protein ACFB4I_21415 [Cyanophyceae cyanobacterium]